MFIITEISIYALLLSAASQLYASEQLYVIATKGNSMVRRKSNSGRHR